MTMPAPLRPDGQKAVIARAICKSGKFETGHGTCALLCTDQLGSPRDSLHGCPHAARIHSDLAAQIDAAIARAEPQP